VSVSVLWFHLEMMFQYCSASFNYQDFICGILGWKATVDSDSTNHGDYEKGNNLQLLLAFYAVQDPHGELTKQNVLIERGSVTKTAAKFDVTVDQVETVLCNARQQLWQHRQLRPRPHLDNKMITSWNGLSSR